MRELQNPFIRKKMKKSTAKIGVHHGLALVLACLLCGCATKIRNSIQELPATFNVAAKNAQDDGYPDLSKIPPVPTNMKTDKEWAAQKNNLNERRIEIEKAPNSQPLTKQEEDISWANGAKDVLLNDPRAQPANPEEEALAWAARMRALLNIPTQPATNN